MTHAALPVLIALVLALGSCWYLLRLYGTSGTAGFIRRAPREVSVRTQGAGGDVEAEALASEGLRATDADEFPGPAAKSSVPWWAVGGALGCVLLVLAFVQLPAWYAAGMSVSSQARIIAVLVLLVPIAVVDLRDRIIPDALLLVALVVRAAAVAADVANGVPHVWSTLRADALFGLVVSVVFLLIGRFARGSLGIGDVKLIAVLSIVLGSRLALDVLSWSFGTAFLWAVLLVLTRRAGRKDSFALAPLIFVGAFASLGYLTLAGAS